MNIIIAGITTDRIVAGAAKDVFETRDDINIRSYHCCYGLLSTSGRERDV